MRLRAFAAAALLLVALPAAAQTQRRVGPITPPAPDDGTTTPRRIVLPWGYVDFGNNEMEIVSTVDDPPKLRLVSPAGGGAVSWSKLRADGGEDEIAMILGQQDERTKGDPTDTSGELRFYVQDGNRPGDAGMFPILIIRHDGLFLRRSDGNYVHLIVDDPPPPQ